MTRTQTMKPVLLMIAMAIGVMVQCRTAEAADRATAVFAGGCFWCVESDFESVPGVVEAVSGFTGGHVENPSYRQVTRGDTGHYEAVQITYDPARVSYAELLHLFFRSVDPTDPGGQFCDRGDAYRTAVFVADPAEQAAAEAARAEAQAELGAPVVTPVLPQTAFYEAGVKHQDYYKGTRRVITRFGIKQQADAYKAYRKACGRDRRVRALWGDEAPFAAHGS